MNSTQTHAYAVARGPSKANEPLADICEAASAPRDRRAARVGAVGAWLGRTLGILGILALVAGLAACGGGGGGSASSTPSASPSGPPPGPLAPSISNLREGGEVHTGFATGTMAWGSFAPGSVEVSVDGGTTWTAAAGTTTWSFQLPAPANGPIPAAWQGGGLHAIAVRAQDAGGVIGPVTTVHVRKGVNRDVNGDGIEDLVVGAPNFSHVGHAYVFHGSTAGVSTAVAATLTGPTSANFGFSVALGDIDGDGYADAVVGAYQAGAGPNGAVYVFRGGPAGVGNRTFAQADVTLTGTGSNQQFGYALATGDVNGDEYADIVATDWTVGNLGAAYVFHSGAGGGVVSGTTGSAQALLGTVADNAEFGLSVAVGDVNGDGYADVVVGDGVGGDPNFTGAVYVFHSGGPGGVAGGDVTTAQTRIVGLDYTVSDFFGGSVALGDVNGDGFADLVVGDNTGGTPFCFCGAVYVFSSSGTPAGIHGGDISNAHMTLLAGTLNSRFSSSVSVGDLNGDGYGDVIVSDPEVFAVTNGNLHLSAGMTYVFDGASAAGPAPFAVDTSAAIKTLTGPIGFGTSVAFRDLNGDGFADIAIGDPGSGTGGLVHVFHSQGAAGVLHANDVHLIGPAASLEGFGASME